MKKIFNMLLCLPLVACVVIGCSDDSIDPVMPDMYMHFEEFWVSQGDDDKGAIMPVGEMLVVRNMDQWRKLFSDQQTPSLELDFTKHAVLIITDRAKGGIHALQNRFMHTTAGEFVLESAVILNYVNRDTVWTRMVRIDYLPTDAKISSKITYKNYEQIVREGPKETQHVDLAKYDPSRIKSNPCIIRSNDELTEYLPGQKHNIDFENYALLLATGSSTRPVKSVDSKLTFAKGGKFSLELVVNADTEADSTQAIYTWSKLLKIPRIPLGANLTMTVDNDYAGEPPALQLPT